MMNMHLKLLDIELKKQNPSKKVVKKLMESSFCGRRRWIKQTCPALTEILAQFPPLKQMIHVSVILLVDYMHEL